jgi:DNA-binding transcriptional LysR family regulator
MSITQAADDLCVTQSAMSKQMRTLEDLLGMRLLHRGYRSISFTEEGERLFRIANASVQQLQEVFGTLDTRGKRPVTITASIGVTGLWLLPRLGDFQRRHPDVDVRVAANNALLDLAAEQIDIAIRYCAEERAPRGARRLFGESIAPVASPALRVGPLASADELARHVLLEFEDRRHWLQWGEWLSARGWSTSQARGVLRFNQYDQAIHAAVAGQGVALGRLELLAPMLADGRLEIVGGTREPNSTHFSYWLVQAERSPRREVQHVIDWMVDGVDVRPPSASRGDEPALRAVNA